MLFIAYIYIYCFTCDSVRLFDMNSQIQTIHASKLAPQAISRAYSISFHGAKCSSADTNAMFP